MVGGFGEGGEDLDEDQLEDLEEKQLLGRIGSLETSKYKKNFLKLYIFRKVFGWIKV